MVGGLKVCEVARKQRHILVTIIQLCSESVRTSFGPGKNLIARLIILIFPIFEATLYVWPESCVGDLVFMYRDIRLGHTY